MLKSDTHNAAPADISATWEQLRLLALRTTRPSTSVVAGMRVAAFEAYLPFIFAQLDQYLLLRATSTQQLWRHYIGVRREHDAETVVLPELLACFAEFALGGELNVLFGAIASLLELLGREFVRQGMVPILVPVAGLALTHTPQDLVDEDVHGINKKTGNGPDMTNLEFGLDNHSHSE